MLVTELPPDSRLKMSLTLSALDGKDVVHSDTLPADTMPRRDSVPPRDTTRSGGGSRCGGRGSTSGMILLGGLALVGLTAPRRRRNDTEFGE